MIADYVERKIPEYYPTMYLDGFEPYEILIAHNKKMREEFLNNDQINDININSNIKVRK